MNKSLLTTAFTLTTDSLLVGFFLLILVSTFAFAVRLHPVTLVNNQILGATTVSELSFYLNTTSNSLFKMQAGADEQIHIQVTHLPVGVSKLSLAQIVNANETEQQFLVDLQLSNKTNELLDFRLNFAGASYEMNTGEAARFIAPSGIGELTLEIQADKQINFPLELTIDLDRI